MNRLPVTSLLCGSDLTGRSDCSCTELYSSHLTTTMENSYQEAFQDLTLTKLRNTLKQTAWDKGSHVIVLYTNNSVTLFISWQVFKKRLLRHPSTTCYSGKKREHACQKDISEQLSDTSIINLKDYYKLSLTSFLRISPYFPIVDSSLTRAAIFLFFFFY